MFKKDGILNKVIIQEEIIRKQLGFVQEMTTLDYNHLDVIRNDWRLDPIDNTITFGGNIEEQ